MNSTSKHPPISLCQPCLTGEESALLAECLASNQLSSVGPLVKRFESQFAAAVGSLHAVACNSGTAAIHLALKLLNLQPGDEVFVSDLTFVASANPILYERVTPVLIDCAPGEWNINAELAADEIKRRARAGQTLPKAVLVVHLLGHLAAMEPLWEVCRKYGVWLIEDAAESLGAEFRLGSLAGRQAGTVGDVGCFSFNGNKLITTGGGGMLTTSDPDLAQRAKHLTTQARLPGAEFWHNEVGFNYRLTNLAAAVGLAQLAELPHFLRRKREIAVQYDAAFASLFGFQLPPRPANQDPAFWLYTLRIHPAQCGVSRQTLIDYLATLDIETRPVWPPLHLQPAFRRCPRLGGLQAERQFAAGLTLPSSVSLTAGEQKRVTQAVTLCHAAFNRRIRNAG